MKVWKQTLSRLLIVSMLATSLLTTVFAASTGYTGNLKWVLDDSGTLTISGTGAMTSTLCSQFKYSYYTKNVVIKEGVTSICDEAFWNCEKMTTISIPDSVTSIGEYAFQDCESLAEITIPDSVTSLGQNTFYYCRALSEVTLPDSMTAIGSYSFGYCSSLTTITIPDGVTSIGNYTFDNCTKLSTITIPDSVTSIGANAFQYCAKLSDVYYGGSAAEWAAISIGSNNGYLTNATIHCAETDEPQSFQFGVDNLSFTNNASDFFNFSEQVVWENECAKAEDTSYDLAGLAEWLSARVDWPCYQISDAMFDQLTTGMSNTVTESLQLQRWQLWGGSCYGMAQVMAIHYMDPDRLPISAIHDLGAPNSSAETENLINYYHLTQNLPVFSLRNKIQCAAINADYSKCLQEIVSNLEAKMPVVACIANYTLTEAGALSVNGGHAVILLEILEENDSVYKVKVCDPNRTEATTMYLYKQAMFVSDAIHISYYSAANAGSTGTLYNGISTYFTSVEDMDIRNYSNPELGYAGGVTDNDDWQITVAANQAVSYSHGDAVLEFENGTITRSENIFGPYIAVGDLDENGTTQVKFLYDGSKQEGDPQMTLQSGTGSTAVSLMLDEWSIALISESAAAIDIDSQTRSVSIAADTESGLSAMLTQNETSADFPWYGVAVDVDDATELVLTACEDGIFVSSDNLSGAKIAGDSNSAVDLLTVDTMENCVLLLNASDTEKDQMKTVSMESRYTVTFDPTGGILNGEGTTATTSDGTVHLPGDPTREGYAFTGWYTEASGGKQIMDDTVFPADKTVYAQWVREAIRLSLENETLLCKVSPLDLKSTLILAFYNAGGKLLSSVLYEDATKQTYTTTLPKDATEVRSFLLDKDSHIPLVEHVSLLVSDIP